MFCEQQQVRGDHYVTMKVAIPRDVSAEERKLLEELQAKGGGKIKGSGKKSKGNKVSPLVSQSVSQSSGGWLWCTTM